MNRKLSGAESTVWLVDRIDEVNAGAVVRIAAPIQEQVLRIALNWLQKRHTMLRTRVDIVGGRLPVQPGDEAIPPISLRVESRLNNDHWQMETQHELALPLPCTREPLVSVVLLKSPEVSEIILTLHHVVNDTATVLYLMRDLLGLLAQLMKGSHIPSLQVYPERRALDHLPAGSARLMSSLMRTTALMVTQVTNVIQQGPQKAVKRSPTKRALPMPTAARHGDALYQKRSARLLHYALSREETARLSNCCEVENTSLHGTVVAAAFQAAVQYVEHLTKQSRMTPAFTCLSAPQLRQPLAAGNVAEIGLFIPVEACACPGSQQRRFWDIARPARTEAFDAAQMQIPLLAVPLPRRMIRHARPLHSSAVVLAGLAHLPFMATMPHETRVSTIGSGMADSFGIVVNQLGGRLVLSFFYPELTLSPGQANLLGMAVVNNLRAAMVAAR
jgi:Condensation domain